MNFDVIGGWVGIIGSVVAIAISILMKRPQSDNLNASTIKSLTETIGQANDNYNDLQKRVDALERALKEYEVWNLALCNQIRKKGDVPISKAQALREAGFDSSVPSAS